MRSLACQQGQHVLGCLQEDLVLYTGKVQLLQRKERPYAQRLPHEVKGYPRRES